MVEEHQGENAGSCERPPLTTAIKADRAKPQKTADKVDRRTHGDPGQPVWHVVTDGCKQPDIRDQAHKRPRPPVQKTDERQNHTGYGDRENHFFFGVEEVFLGGGGGFCGSIGPTRIVTGFGFFISCSPFQVYNPGFRRTELLDVLTTGCSRSRNTAGKEGCPRSVCLNHAV